MPDAAATPTNLATLGTLPESTELSSCPGSAAPPAIPGYELLGELGRGGMGVVFKARQIKLNRLVAIKLLPAHLHGNPEVLKRFRTEAEAVAKLQHPNIVQIYEVGEAGGQPFLALEFVPRGSLADHLDGRPQPISLAADLTRTLALAIHHAHEHGILHRDLKPGNVLISDFGFRISDSPTILESDPIRNPKSEFPNVKVADFGLAKQLTSSDGPTQFGDVVGTPSYMAPEQASGITKGLTGAVDTYALGAILYEMLTGRPPFLGETATHTLLQVLSQEPVRPRELRPDCPRDLEVICLKCLEKNPARRYSSASALADDLRRFRDGEPVVARPAGPIERSVKWARRKPAVAAAIGTAATAAVVLFVLGMLYVLQVRRHNKELGDLAEQERTAREQSRANFQVARRAVKDLLAEVGSKDLASVPQMDPVRRTLLNKAVASMQELLRQDAGNPLLRRELAQVNGDLGEFYELLGDGPKAEQHFNDALRLYRELAARDAANSETQLERALLTMHLALFLGDAGRRDEAISLDDEALALVNDPRHAFDPDYVLARCRILLNRGPLLAKMSRTADEKRDYETARDELKRLIDSYPDRDDWRDSLAAAHNNLGVIANRSERFADAVREFKAGAELFRDLVSRHPESRTYRNKLGVALRNVGHANWWLEQYGDAETAYRASLEVFRALVKDWPAIPEYRLGVAQTLDRIGEMQDYRGQPDGVEQIRESIRIKEQLLAEQPKQPAYLASIAWSNGLMGWSERRKKNWAETERWEREAIALYRAALEIDVRNAAYESFLRKELLQHAKTLLKLRRLDDAAKTVEEVVEKLPGDADEAFDGACVLAQCGERFAERAIALLKYAVKAGAADAKRLKATPELDPLRERADFKALVGVRPL